MPLGTRIGHRPGRQIGLKPGVDALFQQVLFLSAGRPVFTADYYILDPSSGKVLAFVDWNDPTHLLLQTNPARQVRPPQPNPSFKDRLCADFTGSQYYVSNRQPSDWAFLHAGNGSVFGVLTTTSLSVNQRWLSTRNSTGNPGFSSHVTTGGNLQMTILSNGGLQVLDVSSPISLNVPAQWSMSYTEGASTELYYKTTLSVENSAMSTNPPDSSAPPVTLWFGAQAPSVILPFFGRTPGFFFTPGAVNRAAGREALATLYGVPA